MMESELLREVVAELKEIKKSVKNLEIDISEIKYVVNKGVFADDLWAWLDRRKAQA